MFPAESHRRWPGADHLSGHLRRRPPGAGSRTRPRPPSYPTRPCLCRDPASTDRVSGQPSRRPGRRSCACRARGERPARLPRSPAGTGAGQQLGGARALRRPRLSRFRRGGTGRGARFAPVEGTQKAAQRAPAGLARRRPRPRRGSRRGGERGVDRGSRPGRAAPPLRLRASSCRSARPHRRRFAARRGAQRHRQEGEDPDRAFARAGPSRHRHLFVALPLRAGPRRAAVPGRSRRAAQRRDDPPGVVRGARARLDWPTGRPQSLAPQLRHPPDRPRRRPALASGVLGHASLVHANSTRGRRRPPPRRLPQRPSAGPDRDT